MASGSSLNFTRFGIRRMIGAVCGLAEGRLVDGPKCWNEEVVNPVEFAAGLVAVRFGPAFVLRLQDEAGGVSKLDEGGRAACR